MTRASGRTRLLQGIGIAAAIATIVNAVVASPCPERGAGVFPSQWINGTNCAAEPQIQEHAYNADLYILRQSLCTNFEAPFLYLIFGQHKVLMLDTGAGNIPIAETVNHIIETWLATHGKESIELIVAHSHGHGDHVAGDDQFTGRAATVVVGRSRAEVQAFFGIENWPTEIVSYDLGGDRIVDVIPIPGHEEAHIALYDRETGLLLTGDTFYPGRLYFPARQLRDYLASIERLLQFTDAHPVCWVLGTHIEMTNVAGKDFPFQLTQHPNEHNLQLTTQHLRALRGALRSMQGRPRRLVLADFIIFPLAN